MEFRLSKPLASREVRVGVLVVRHFAVPAFLERLLGRLLPAGAEQDPRLRGRHIFFLAIHLGLGFTALALVPLVLAAESAGLVKEHAFAVVTLGAVGLYALAGLGLAVKPRLDHGLYASAAVSTVLVCWLAEAFGGASSPLWPAMVIVPATVALTRHGKAIAGAALLAASAIALTATGTAGYIFVLAAPEGLPAVIAILAVLAVAAMAILAVRISRADVADLRERMGLHRQLAALATDLVTFHDRRGDVISSNDVSAMVLGVEPSRLLGGGLYERVHPGDRPHFLLALADAVNGRAREMDLRIAAGEESPHGDTDMRTMVATLTPGHLLDPDCRAAVVVRLQDVSTLKSMEKRLNGLEAREKAATGEVSVFLRRLTHDFRSPLNAVIGFSDLLGQEVFGRLETDRQREYVRLIGESGRHLLDLIDQSADFARLEAGHMELDESRTELGPVFRAALEQVQPRAAMAGVEILADISANLPEQMIDRRALRRMVEALLWHSVRKMPGGSRLLFRVGADTGLLAIGLMDGRANPVSLEGEGENTLPLELARRYCRLLGGVMATERDGLARPRLTIRLPLVRDRDRAHDAAHMGEEGNVHEFSSSRLVS